MGVNHYHFKLTESLSFKKQGYTSAGIHFFQLLIVMVLRVSCYTLIALLVKAYTSLRVTFSKMEWRTVLGLVMFGTMGDLISEASDAKDWRSYVPTISNLTSNLI